jgi:hypothetical protein
MIKFLHGKVSANGWFDVNQPKRPLGVLLRQSSGGYLTEPKDLSSLLVQAVDKLGFEVTLTISTDATEAIFDFIKDNDDDIPDIVFSEGSRLRVVNSVADLYQTGLSQAGKSQHTALLKVERILLVWHDDVDKALLQAAHTEEKILGLVSSTRSKIKDYHLAYQCHSANTV